jgi:hypothetical protein
LWRKFLGWFGGTEFFEQRVEARVVRLKSDAECTQPSLELADALGLESKDPFCAFGAPVDQLRFFEDTEMMGDGGL